MTPRTQIVWLDTGEPLAENLERMRKTPHSRYPVIGPDGVVGIVRLKDLVPQLGEPRAVDLFKGMRQALFVPETTPAMKLLDTFRAADVRLALVVDEYGDVQGMVTPSDILGAVLGEEALASATGPKPVTRRDDGSYLIDGMYPADELKTLLQLHRLPGEDEHDFSTIAGMMIARFGRIPEAGDHFAWRGARFEVVDMDGPRIDKVLVVPGADREAG
jgi:putative hemolysin